MITLRAALVLAFTTASLVACSAPTESTDGGGDASTDTHPDSTAHDATDIAPSDVPADADTACPSIDMAGTIAGASCAMEGQVCRYGYVRPECGGRTLTCTAGHWAEEHSDPQPACFMDGGPPDAEAFGCGTQTCDPSQVCLHECGGADVPDARPIAPHCGSPSECMGGVGHSVGHDYYCDLCA